MTTLYLGVHHTHGAAGQTIRLVTEAALDGPWTFGGERPATHAFVVFEHGDGAAYRLDAQPGGALWTPWDVPLWATKLWLVTASPDTAQHAHRVARAATGRQYDWAELGAQAASVLNRLPPIQRFASQFAMNPFVRDACICTRLAIEVLGAAQYRVNVPDLLPERLASWAAARFTEVDNPLDWSR